MGITGAIAPDNISQYLKVFITDMEHGDMVVGYIGDGASMALSAEWNPPFAGLNLGSIAGEQAANAAGGLVGLAGKLGGDKAQKLAEKLGGAVSGGLGSLASHAGDLASLFGTAMAAQINSAMVWTGQQPPTFSMPIYFLAYADPYLEVQAAIKSLEQMASPELKAALPGGRTPSKVTLDIGRRIKITDCIIQEVTCELDAPRNADGYFLQNNVTLQLSGQVSYNRSEFDGMFI